MGLVKKSILRGPQAAGSRLVLGLGYAPERTARGGGFGVATVLRCDQAMA